MRTLHFVNRRLNFTSILLFMHSKDQLDAHLATLDQARVAQLMAVMLCSQHMVAIIARKYPPVIAFALSSNLVCQLLTPIC